MAEDMVPSPVSRSTAPATPAAPTVPMLTRERVLGPTPPYTVSVERAIVPPITPETVTAPTFVALAPIVREWLVDTAESIVDWKTIAPPGPVV